MTHNDRIAKTGGLAGTIGLRARETMRYRVLAKRERTLVSAVKVMFFKGVGAGLGLAAALGIAYLFGASAAADAYFFARRFVSNLATMAERVFETVFVPGLVRAARQGGIAAVLVRTRRIERICYLGGIVFCGLAMFFAPTLVDLAAPGMSGEGRDSAIFFLRILLISLPISIATSMTGATLTSLRAFTLPVIARLAQRVLVALALLLVPLGFGLDLAVYGVLIGTLITLGVMTLAIRRLRTAASKTPVEIPKGVEEGVAASLTGGWGRNAAILVLSLYFLAAGLIDTAFASIAGAGSIAILALSQRVSTTGAGQIANSLMPIYYTNFSETTVADEAQLFSRELSNAIRTSLLFIAPIACVLMGLSEAIANLILANGAFDDNAAAQAGTIIALFALISLINTPISCLQIASLAHPRLPHLKLVITSITVGLIVRVAVTSTTIETQGVIAVGLGALAGVIAYLVSLAIWARRLAGASMVPKDLRAISWVLGIGVLVAIAARFGGTAVLASGLSTFPAILLVAVIGLALGGLHILLLAAIGLPEARDLMRMPFRLIGRILGRGAKREG